MCQNRTGSSPTPVASVRFRLGFGHRWHCMTCTSSWPEYIHNVNIMYISVAFIQIPFTIVHGEYTNKSSLIQRVSHHLNILRNHCLNQYRTTAPCTSIGRCVSISSARLYSELIQMYTYIQRDGKGLALVKGRKFDYDDVIKWKPFLRHRPSVLGIKRSPVNPPHKGQRRGALMLSLVCAWIYGLVNNRDAGDLGRNRTHYDVIVMK